MSVKEAIMQADDLTTKSWALAGLAIVIQDAIYHGVFAPEEYEGAMFTLVRMAAELRDETAQVVDNLYTALREAK